VAKPPNAAADQPIELPDRFTFDVATGEETGRVFTK
jgi:hypothetical protein